MNGADAGSQLTVRRRPDQLVAQGDSRRCGGDSAPRPDGGIRAVV